MLTKKELQWLDNRGKFSCWYCPDIPQAMCTMGERPAHCAIMDTDWKEAAEFEARVAAKLAEAYGTMMDYNEKHSLCQTCRFEVVKTLGCMLTCAETALRWAQLDVEEEMDG